MSYYGRLFGFYGGKVPFTFKIGSKMQKKHTLKLISFKVIKGQSSVNPKWNDEPITVAQLPTPFAIFISCCQIEVFDPYLTHGSKLVYA